MDAGWKGSQRTVQLGRAVGRADLRSLAVDTFFMGADGIDAVGMSNSTVEEAEVKRLALGSARTRSCWQTARSSGGDLRSRVSTARHPPSSPTRPRVRPSKTSTRSPSASSSFNSRSLSDADAQRDNLAFRRDPALGDLRRIFGVDKPVIAMVHIAHFPVRRVTTLLRAWKPSLRRARRTSSRSRRRGSMR